MIRFLLIVQFSLVGLIARADPLQIVDSDTSDPRDYVKSTEQLLLETSSVPVSKAMERISSRVSKLFEECKPPAIEHVPRLTAACKMVEEIHRISPKVALPLAKRHTSDCLAAAKLSGTAGDRFLATAAVFCQWRYKAGDEAAVKEYASLLASADPDSFTQLPKLLKFLLTYPEEPVLAEVAEGLFSESDGEWNPIVGFKDRYYAGYSARDAYTEPLLWRHPAFKRQLIRLLDDLTAAGTLTVIDEESFAISITNGWTDSMTNPNWRGTLPKAGTKVEMRTCDFHALHAAKQADGLAFNPFSDIGTRNKALKNLRSYYSK